MHANVQVSISHTGQFAFAVAFLEAYPMAVDMEIICPEKIETIQTQLTQSEKRLITKFFNEMAMTTLLWTAK